MNPLNIQSGTPVELEPNWLSTPLLGIYRTIHNGAYIMALDRLLAYDPERKLFYQIYPYAPYLTYPPNRVSVIGDPPLFNKYLPHGNDTPQNVTPNVNP